MCPYHVMADLIGKAFQNYLELEFWLPPNANYWCSVVVEAIPNSQWLPYQYKQYKAFNYLQMLWMGIYPKLPRSCSPRSLKLY